MALFAEGRKRRIREVGVMKEDIYQRIKTYEMEGLVSVSLDQVRGWDEPQSNYAAERLNDKAWPAAVVELFSRVASSSGPDCDQLDP
jgi:hypothetical protein